jgi:hypothetical protein
LPAIDSGTAIVSLPGTASIGTPAAYEFSIGSSMARPHHRAPHELD